MNRTTIKPEKISIDTLGQMISRLEDRVIVRSDGLEQKVDALEQKFDQKFDTLEKTMNFRFDASARQVDNVYLNYTTLHEHGLLKNRVKKVEHKMGIK